MLSIVRRASAADQRWAEDLHPVNLSVRAGGELLGLAVGAAHLGDCQGPDVHRVAPRDGNLADGTRDVDFVHGCSGVSGLVERGVGANAFAGM